MDRKVVGVVLFGVVAQPRHPQQLMWCGATVLVLFCRVLVVAIVIVAVVVMHGEL